MPTGRASSAALAQLMPGGSRPSVMARRARSCHIRSAYRFEGSERAYVAPSPTHFAS